MSFWCGYCHELSSADQQTIIAHQREVHVAEIEAFGREMGARGPIIQELTLW